MNTSHVGNPLAQQHTCQGATVDTPHCNFCPACKRDWGQESASDSSRCARMTLFHCNELVPATLHHAATCNCSCDSVNRSGDTHSGALTCPCLVPRFAPPSGKALARTRPATDCLRLRHLSASRRDCSAQRARVAAVFRPPVARLALWWQPPPRLQQHQDVFVLVHA